MNSVEWLLVALRWSLGLYWLDRLDIKLLKEKLIISKNKKNQLQLGLKIQMNSIYGAFCHPAFLCFNPDIAESITVQGQDLVKFGEKILDHYFHNIW